MSAATIITLYHGSPQKVEHPSLGKGSPHNDYGRGFYCTPDLELAKEWACKRRQNGFANRYRLRTRGLRTLDLLDGSYTALHWIALLLKNREFSLSGDYAIATRGLILERFLIDLDPYDIVVGYRADDAYFAFAESFVEGSLSLSGLERALRLGNLGEQTDLVSEAAFDRLTFESAEPAACETYFPRFLNRDNSARSAYRAYAKARKPQLDDLVAIDILRMEEAELDARIQRISRR